MLDQHVSLTLSVLLISHLIALTCCSAVETYTCQIQGVGAISEVSFSRISTSISYKELVGLLLFVQSHVLVSCCVSTAAGSGIIAYKFL